MKWVILVPQISGKVKIYIANCLKCVAFSPLSKKEGYLNFIPKSDIPFLTSLIDVFAPTNPKIHVKKHILLVIDDFTKFLKPYAVIAVESK